MAKKPEYEKWYRAVRSLWFDFDCPHCGSREMIKLADAEPYVYCYQCNKHSERMAACDAGILRVVRNKKRIDEWIRRIRAAA